MMPSISSNLEGMYAARGLLKSVGTAGLRDMTVREIGDYIYDQAAKLDYGSFDREAFKRAFVREINGAVFHIYY